MIVNKTNEPKKVGSVRDDDRVAVLNFLQGAVYCWCANRKGEYFAARDLVGGDNKNWNGTPLQKIYTNLRNNKSDADAYKQAKKDVGWLLYAVIYRDERKFETKKAAQTRQYRWVA